MQELYKAWQVLLDRHSQLLSELEKGLHQERKALLAGDCVSLREASLFKERLTHKVLNIEDQIRHFKQKTAADTGVDPEASLYNIFKSFETEQMNALLEKRRGLLRQSQMIDRLNRFNHQCLDTYMDYVDGVRGIISQCRIETCRTYTARGQTRNRGDSGRLLDRSL